MLVDELMSREVSSVDKNCPLSDACRSMEKKGASRVIVTSGGGLYGILSLKDVVEHLGSSRHSGIPPSSLHVSTAATPAPLTLELGGDVKEAARLMLERGVSALPVVHDGEVEGIITKTHLVRTLRNSRMVLEGVMTPRLESVSPKTRVVHARRIMLDKDLGRLVVVEGDELVGILTEGDTARALSAFRKAAGRYQRNRIRNMIVEDIMTLVVRTLKVEDTVGEAVRLMLGGGFSGIPLTREGKLSGMVTKTDLVRLI